MKLGMLVRADNGGLGAQTWEAWKHLKPFKTMVVDISRHNGYKQYPERYQGENVMFVKGFPTPNDIESFLQDLDVVFTIESPYNYYLINRARELGVKTVIQYNYEFMDWLDGTERWPLPDLFIAPSLWHYDDVPFKNKVFIPAPVNREVLPFTPRKKAQHFVHIAGHKTFEDRNGTQIVLEASKYVKTKSTITVLTQDDIPEADYNKKKLKIVKADTDNYYDVLQQDEYDVLLLPRRYGGLSLQLNEALSLGMPVIMSNVVPQADFMPKECLVLPCSSKKIYTRMELDCYSVDPRDLARKIDHFALYPELVHNQSYRSDEIADTISWDVLKDRYIKEFKKLCST